MLEGDPIDHPVQLLSKKPSGELKLTTFSSAARETSATELPSSYFMLYSLFTANAEFINHKTSKNNKSLLTRGLALQSSGLTEARI